jgi:drug/metabolite transporter (DMT)-like permease
MTVFGTLALFVRHISLSSGELALYRAVLAAALIGLYLLCTRQRLDVKAFRREIPLLALSGAAMGLNWILLFEAYRYTTVSVATLSYYFAPVIVTALSPFLFREKLTVKQLICFAMSTVGLVLVIGVTDLEGGSAHLTGILFGLGAAVFYAAVILLNKCIKRVSGIHRTFLQLVAAIVVMIPYVASQGGVHLGGMDTVGWACLLVVGLVHTGITYCLYFSALKDLSGQEVSILSYIDPLVAVVVSVLLLHEALTWTQALGGALILGFTIWNELRS